MKGILYYAEGLREALWEFRFILYLWFLSLAMVFTLYLPAKTFFSIKLSHFPDWGYLTEHPAYISLACNNDNSGLFFATVFTVFLLFYIASLIVEGGIWAGILRREPFSYWRKYFGRFLLLEILTPVIYLPYILTAGIFFLLIKPIPYYREKAFSLALVAYLLILFLLLVLASINKDYAKLAVVRDNRSAVRAVLFSWKVLLMRWFSSLIMGIASLLLWAIPLFLLKPLLSPLPPLLYIFLFQVFVLVKAYSRISLFFGEKYLAREFS